MITITNSNDDVEKQSTLSSTSSLSSKNRLEKNVRKIGIVIGMILVISILIVSKPSFTSNNNNNNMKMNNKLIKFDELTTSSSTTSTSIVGNISSTSTEEEENIATSKSSSDMVFTLKRTGYDPLSQFTVTTGWKASLRYKHLKSYVGIVEPHVPMSLYVEDSKESKGYVYSYKICKYTSSTGVKSDCSASGELSENKEIDITTACSPYEEYYLYVEEYNSKKKLKRSGEGIILCQYVRREIRSLTSDDLNKAMDSMYTLWSVSEEDGQKLYGENYHSSTYFTEAHTFNAGQQDADHIHEGLGFLPQHIKMTNMFEESIQSVDPSFSLPYWDFTIDTEEGLSLDESPMFTSDTFGSIKFPKDDSWGWTYRDDKIEDAAIPNGRWKKQLADVNTRYAFPGNSFGYMRGPWNLNPSPYISRFSISTSSLPKCTSYYSWLEITSFKDFLDIAPYAPHASVHGAVGAVFGCDMLDSLTEKGVIPDENTQRSICKKWGFIMKELYRANSISARSNDECSYTNLDYDGISCGFVCPTDEDELDDLSEKIKGQLKTFNVDDSEENLVQWRDFICSGDASKVFVGDHLESASPSDPSFWPVHPNQERLLHLKYVSGGFLEDVWPTNAKQVCDKHSCYESKYGSKDSYTECCYGHYKNDQLLDFVNGDVNAGYGPTNIETMEASDSSSETYSMTYIYDDFTWSHCKRKNFMNLSKKLLTSMSTFKSSISSSKSSSQ